MVDVERAYDERFSLVRIEHREDLPPRDDRYIDVALLDMNCGFANVGHDAIVEIVHDATLGVSAELERDDRRVRVLSYAVRDKHMLPDYRSSRHLLYLGTGGPGHLDPRLNTMDRGAAEIVEDGAWEPVLWALFEAIAANESAALYAVCHTFGLMCRWSGIASPELRGSEKGGPKSGVGTNIFTSQARAHPYFRKVWDDCGGPAFPVLDSRYYDLIPTGRMRPGSMTIAFEAATVSDDHGDAMTMLEIARFDDGTPRMFGVNSHPEIGSADDVAAILRRMLAHGKIDRPTFERRSAVLPVLRDDRPIDRLRVADAVFGHLIETKLHAIVRGS